MNTHRFREEPPEPPANAVERWMHAILGAMLGVGAALLTSLLRDLEPELIIAVFVVFPILGALGAVKWGERFWNWVRGHPQNWA